MEYTIEYILENINNSQFKCLQKSDLLAEYSKEIQMSKIIGEYIQIKDNEFTI